MQGVLATLQRKHGARGRRVHIPPRDVLPKSPCSGLQPGLAFVWSRHPSQAPPSLTFQGGRGGTWGTLSSWGSPTPSPGDCTSASLVHRPPLLHSRSQASLRPRRARFWVLMLERN